MIISVWDDQVFGKEARVETRSVQLIHFDTVFCSKAPLLPKVCRCIRLYKEVIM